MLRLRSSVSAAGAPRFSELLGELEGVRRIVSQPSAEEPESFVFVADVEPAAADRLVEAIAAIGIGIDDYVLARVDVVAPERRHLAGDTEFGGFAWVEVMGEARANSRPLARYLALIVVAAVIAALGVIKGSSILIIGAMAVSPDLLPICATCVGLVGHRLRLAERAFLTLTLGLALVVVTAAVLTAALQGVDLLPAGFSIADSNLNSLAHTDYSTVLIALAAGVGGDALLRDPRQRRGRRRDLGDDDPRLRLPRRGDRRRRHRTALGALVVLVVNVALLIVSGTLTLVAQRWLAKRSGALAA